MTVIAWDGKTLAADKQAGTEAPRTVTKIRKAKNGNLMGASGTAHGDAELMKWYDDGADPEKLPAVHRDVEKCSHLVVIERETLRVLNYCTGPIPAIFEDALYATGSGRDFALMAMHLGRSAEDAVRLTCDLSADCGMGIDTLRFETDDFDIPF